jgi:molybdopterin molybdotransferase
VENQLRMITFSAYLSMLTSVLPLGRKEKVSINKSLGRVLAEDIQANIDQPPFDKSAIDGYACARKDLPGPLVVVGQIAAGAYVEAVAGPQQCYRIFTGAPVPPGADCVIMQENTALDPLGNVLFTQKETKNNICYQGEDIKAGEVAIKAGAMIQPQYIAVMAGFGITEPVVYSKPRVAIICSGSELVEPEVKPGKAMIRNSNAYQLMGQLWEINMEADYLGIVADKKEELGNSIRNAVGKYDVLIVTGGVSVGDYDFMPGVLASLNATVHFSSMNIQPGKPVLFATLGNTYILGLSGNPVSSYLQFLLVAKPLLFRLSGCTGSALKLTRTLLAETIKRKKGNRKLYIPVTLLPSGFARPVPFNGSAHITALTGADGFAILDEDVNEILENQLINILLL